MARLGNGRGSKSTSGSGSARDRISAAREKMNGSSKRSPKGQPKIGGGKKGDYILTESVDNLIGGKFTKKSGPRRATREEVLEARKKRQEQKSGTGPRRVTREELLEARKKVGPGRKTRQEANEEIRKAYRESLIEKRKKAEESKAKQGTRLKPGGNREGVAPKRPTRVGIADKARPGGNQIDKVRGPKSRPTGTNQNIGQTGGNVGPGGKGPNRTGGGSKSGIGQGGKRGGPPRQTGGNVGPGGKGPNRAGIGQGGKRGGPPRQTGGNVGPGGKGPNRAGLTEYGIL